MRLEKTRVLELGYGCSVVVVSCSAFSIDPKTDRFGWNDNFVATIKYNDGSGRPIPFRQLIQATAISFDIEDMLWESKS